MSLEVLYNNILSTQAEFEKKFQEKSWIRLWDANWNLIDTIEGEYEQKFKFINNDSGNASVSLPMDHHLSEFMMDYQNWPTKSMYLTFDKDGARWSGRIENVRVDVTYDGDREIEITAVHDYQKLKELLVWSNPFLPAEVQFPKAWYLYGPARWAVATTLLFQLIRKNNSLWMIPDDPMDFGQWFDLDMSNWNMAVKPVDFFQDTSLTTLVSSRFKYFHDCVAPICADSQLSITCRRYLPGDENPLPGKNLRYGCLVFDVEDKAGYNKETSFGGNLLTGLSRQIRRVLDDGMTEGLETLPRVTYPDEYRSEGFFGSLPEAPWVVLDSGDYTGVEATTVEYTPPGPSQFVTGGSSMPGVNETIKAAVIGVGGVFGSIIRQSQLGSVANALLEPLYSDVFMAFMAHKHHDRIQEQGWDYPFEYWVDGADKAYTLSALTSLREAKYNTREKLAATVKLTNGAPYWVGPVGHGDFFIGDRVAVHALGMPENQLVVEQVTSLEYTRSAGTDEWNIEISQPEFTSGLAYLADKFEQNTAGLKELGVW